MDEHEGGAHLGTGLGTDLGTAEPEPEHDALVQRLGLIEDQPLTERAEAYARVHAELQAHLEGSDERR